MQLGFVGLGRMGANMVRRLVAGGHDVVAYDRDPDRVREAAAAGARPAYSLAEVVGQLAAPRAVWVMLPAGEATGLTLEELGDLLRPGDIVVDGGNSHYRDTLARAQALAARQVHLVDAGTSGGIWGLEIGYCLMVGGEAEAVARLEPALRTLAPPEGYLHVGPTGSGHFVKMVHNGIEYGIMEAYGEGFELLARAPFPLALDRIARLWNRGSVIRSWLLELLERALAQDPELQGLKGYVEDSGEGRWTVEAAMAADVPIPVLALALFQRYRSRQEESFAAKVVAALRREFGGHPVRTP